jgi:lactate dehydrogenase-like 2-hydroxyacid dehydrogenase
MHIAYTARSAKAALPWSFEPTPVALAARSDFLVLITPGGAGTRHLVNAEVLQALGQGRGDGILVNVARGSVVDEPALIDALSRGVIAGAALDVFADEPNVPQALRDMPQVVLAPHIGSSTAATRQAMADLAFANLREHFAGGKPPTPVPECR